MSAGKPIHLIINADDYGYFPCVSRGILDAAISGKITATGILANSLDLTNQLEWLNPIDALDLGVHLNLTYGRPLSSVMADKLSNWNGQFPGAYVMSSMVLNNKIDINDVRTEWCTQIEACRSKKLMFLNSHEHIHMLPPLFNLTQQLAQEYQIPHVRFTRAEWLLPLEISQLVRNMLIQLMQTLNHNKRHKQPIPMLGLSKSGKLNIDHLIKIFSKMIPGQTYELMCHPGCFDPGEITDHKLIAYHEWESELSILKSQKTQDLYKKFGINLTNYSNINN